MANKIVAVLRHPPLASTLRQHGSFEVRRRSWADAARACVGVYDQALGMMKTVPPAIDETQVGPISNCT